jgi:hypothetical protein
VPGLGWHVERLEVVIDGAVARKNGEDLTIRLSAGLEAGLELLATDPELARRLLVEAPVAGGDVRLEYERALTRLEKALRGIPHERPDDEEISVEQARLFAGGLVSHLSGRVLAGEAERLPEDRDLLLRYLLVLSPRYTF